MGEVPIFLRRYLDLFISFFNKIGTQKKSKDEIGKLLNLYLSDFDIEFES